MSQSVSTACARMRRHIRRIGRKRSLGLLCEINQPRMPNMSANMDFQRQHVFRTYALVDAAPHELGQPQGLATGVPLALILFWVVA